MRQLWCVAAHGWYSGPGVFPLVAQTNPVQVTVNTTGQFLSGIGAFLPNLLGALAILIIGWLVATIVASVVQGLLKRTNFDNRLAGWMSGSQTGESTMPVEKWVAAAVFWLIMAFVLVGFLDALKLPAVSAPLNSFLQQVFNFLPRVASAALLLGVAWLLATLVKTIVTRGLGRFNLEARLAQQTGATPGESPIMLSETFGNALYWFIFLFFLPLILDVLQLQGPLQPVQNLLDQVLSALPRILTAILIGVIGWFIARLVRMVVTNFLEAVGTNQLGSRIGLTQVSGGLSLAGLLGTLAYAFVLLFTAIAALNALNIQAISAPAISMLEQILDALPRIFTAALILAIAYVIGRFVADLVARVLTSIGFNNIFSWLGLPTLSTPPRPVDPTPAPDDFLGQSTVIPPSTPGLPRQTPSEIVGIVVLVGILLTGAVAAVETLQFAALTEIVNAILAVLGNVLVGLIVLGIGLYLANLAFSLITRSGGRQANVLAQTARIAIIAFAGAMALDRMGVASNIVNLAFGLLLGAIAVAIGVAFGLGGRNVADELLREWLGSFRRQ
jgi:Conserved TM helix